MTKAFSDHDHIPANSIDKNAYDEFYDKLRHTIDGYVARHTSSPIAEMVLYVPDFFYLLTKLAADPRVPQENKNQIIVAIAYFLSPLDLIPDALVGYGWLDDLYLALVVTDNLLYSIDHKIIMEYWPGEEDMDAIVRDTLERLNNMLGTSPLKRILDRRLRHAEDIFIASSNEETRDKAVE